MVLENSWLSDHGSWDRSQSSQERRKRNHATPVLSGDPISWNGIQKTAERRRTAPSRALHEQESRVIARSVLFDVDPNLPSLRHPWWMGRTYHPHTGQSSFSIILFFRNLPRRTESQEERREDHERGDDGKQEMALPSETHPLRCQCQQNLDLFSPTCRSEAVDFNRREWPKILSFDRDESKNEGERKRRR